MELVARFPPSEVENLTVWRHVLLRALSQDVRLRVESDIVNLAQSVLKDWENGGYRLGQVDKVVRATSTVRGTVTAVTPSIQVFCPSVNLEDVVVCVQNALLWAVLVVVRGFPAPDERHVLSTVGLVTQLWLRLSPEQVRTEPQQRTNVTVGD